MNVAGGMAVLTVTVLRGQKWLGSLSEIFVKIVIVVEAGKTS